MSNNEHKEDEDKQDFDLKSKDETPTSIFNWGYELQPKPVGETYLTSLFKDITEKFDETDLEKSIFEKIFSSGIGDESYVHTYLEERLKEKPEILEPSEPEISKDSNSTEIIGEEQNLEKLIETNQFLAIRNDELIIKLEKLTENYQKLTKETKDEIALLNKRIEELIKSKVSVSRTPSYWVDEVFSEEFERENVEE